MDGRRSMDLVTKEAALVEELLEKVRTLEEGNDRLTENLEDIMKKKGILERKVEKIEKSDLNKKCDGLEKKLQVWVYTYIRDIYDL